MARRKDGELDLTAVNALAFLGQAEPVWVAALQQQLLEIREVRLLGFAAASASDSNPHLAPRGANSEDASVSVFSIPRLITIHLTNTVPSFSCLLKIEKF